VQLISMVVGSRRAPRPPAIVDRWSSGLHRPSTWLSLRCARRVELTADQQDRLKAAIANATGKDVTVKVVVDRSVIGGLLVTVGDTVIDGTVRTRLDQLKSRL
jgi:F-type H+-transporting ATPase subunit delta